MTHDPSFKREYVAPLTKATPTTGRVIINALAARHGGGAHATVHLAHLLAHDPAVDEIIVVAWEDSLVAKGIRPGSLNLSAVTLHKAKRFELAQRLLWEAFRLPTVIRSRGASTLMTWSGMLPRTVEAQVVCYLANPLIFERRTAANRLRRWAVSRTARRGAHILVPSNAMAALVNEAIGPFPGVVPLGVDHTCFKPARGFGTELLCVADFYRHKRHDVLLDAWAALDSPRPRLRLIGDPHVPHSWYRKVTAQAAEYRGLGEIVFDSGLSLDQLINAYHCSRVVALPSEHESFGLTLLEAQACGIPAVVRDLPALRETGGKGATYVVGDCPHDWAEALQRLLSEDAVHAAARAEGLQNASNFSWERTADAVRLRLQAAVP